jgi:hypothetical protein
MADFRLFPISLRHLIMTEFDQPLEDATITDVCTFFHELTTTYQEFGQRLETLITRLEAMTPAKLDATLIEVQAQWVSLQKREQKLFAILELASEELSNSPMVTDCKAALSQANISSNLLYQRLHVIREKLALPTKMQQAIQAYKSMG